MIRVVMRQWPWPRANFSTVFRASGRAIRGTSRSRSNASRVHTMGSRSSRGRVPIRPVTGHFVSTMGVSGSGSASEPSTTVRFMASSAFTSACASSSAVPIPMISCMCVGSSFWMASSSRSFVTTGSSSRDRAASPSGPAPFPADRPAGSAAAGPESRSAAPPRPLPAAAPFEADRSPRWEPSAGVNAAA